MVYAVRDVMKGAYPELVDSAERVAKVVEAEEKQFDRVLKIGLSKLNASIATAIAEYKLNTDPERLAQIEKDAGFEPGTVISEPPPTSPELNGMIAFHLYETFGLPLDFMVDAARDAGIGFDMEGFERARAEEQARARASWKGGSQKTASPAFRDLRRRTSMATGN